MVVDGMDRLEIQDKLSRIKSHIAESEKGEITAEGAYKAIKQEVND